MIIKYSIDPTTTGENTPKQNRLYAEALQGEIEAAYPDYNIEVLIADDSVPTRAWCDNDEQIDIASDVCRIAGNVWDKADY